MDIRSEFSPVLLNASGSSEVHDVAEVFSKLLDYLEQIAPQCRDLSLAKTNLETACFFAKRAVARKPENAHGYEEPKDMENAS